jgi:hypothetical protein
MPQVDHRVSVEEVLSYEQRMLLAILMKEINIVRTAASLPARNVEYLRQEVRDYRRTHPRNEGTP